MSVLRMLREDDADVVLKMMVEGFSDYIIEVNVKEDGYRRKFALDGVDYEASFGMFENGMLCGVTMNAIGIWKGKKTVYDAGTVVLREHRGKGVSTRMFEYAVPKLSAMGFEKYLLEVICDNEPAVRLYNKLGFCATRRLGVFYRESEDVVSHDNGLDIRKVVPADIVSDEMCNETGAAWQNSNKWIERGIQTGYELEARKLYVDGQPAALGVLAPRSGRVIRLNVRKEFRRNGYGQAILGHLSKLSTKPLIFLNIDLSNVKAISFLHSARFIKKVEQFEMELDI